MNSDANANANEYDVKGRLRVYYRPEKGLKLSDIPLADVACYYCSEPVLRAPRHEIAKLAAEEFRVLGGLIPPQHIEQLVFDPSALQSVGLFIGYPDVMYQWYHDGSRVFYHRSCYEMMCELARVVAQGVTLDDTE